MQISINMYCKTFGTSCVQSLQFVMACRVSSVAQTCMKICLMTFQLWTRTPSGWYHCTRC